MVHAGPAWLIGFLALVGAATPAPVLAAGQASGAAGVIKCWTNKDGVQECGNAVPPEYAQEGHAQIHRSGKVRHVERAKTHEELEVERRRAEAEQARRAQADERAAHDHVLLQTFLSEHDLTLTRDGKLSVIDARIRVAESRLADLERNQEQLRQQAAHEERSSQGISERLRQDLLQLARQLAENRAFIDGQLREQEELRAQFEADLERFRALKSGAARPGDL
jgi:hypothetical protein